MRLFKRNYSIIFLFFLNIFFCSAQDQVASVNAILLKAQQVFTTSPNYSLDVDYKMFGNYKTTDTLEAFSGELVTTNKLIYLKLKNTIFLTGLNASKSLKIYKDEKVIELSNQLNKQVDATSPLNVEQFIKPFKNKKIEDRGDYYLCTLLSDKVTQMPYGKIEIYINKTSFLITKQVLYFLMDVPYIDKNGKRQHGNPRLEVTLSNFKNTVTKDQKVLTDMSQYVTKIKDGLYAPSLIYKDFKIIQN